MTARTRLSLLAVLFVGTGCGARTELFEPEPAEAGAPNAIRTSCPQPAPRCVIPGDACAAPTVVNASCNEASLTWSCPSGARVYARAAPTATCLPFRHTGGLEEIGHWGYGSFTRIPVDGGHCLWIASTATLSGGQSASNIALEPDVTAPFGTCPETSVMPPTPIVTVEGGADPKIMVAISGGYRIAGVTRVLYRLFQIDPTAVYGATELGGGLGRYDPGTQRIVIPPLTTPFPWGLDLDLGDAVLTSGDQAFVWGCSRPGAYLEEGCDLARLDASDSIALFSGGSTWIPSTDATRGATVFSSGTWLASVAMAAGALRHVFAIDFGRDLRLHTASAPTGPWSSESLLLAHCDVPSGDPVALCAGPIIHEELSDPTHPGELAISYNLGTTGTPIGDASSYWPRLVWLNTSQ